MNNEKRDKLIKERKDLMELRHYYRGMAYCVDTSKTDECIEMIHSIDREIDALSAKIASEY